MNKQRHAYTLLEMMIVLVIIVAMFAIAWPRMRGMSGRAALREAAVDLKVALGDARDEAVRSGLRVRFAYAIAPKELNEIVNTAEATKPQSHLSPVELPYGITYASADDFPTEDNETELALVPESLPDSQREQELVAANQIGNDTFRYVTFFPDGRSTAAEIYLRADDTKEIIPITVRALTGGVKIGSVIRLRSK